MHTTTRFPSQCRDCGAHIVHRRGCPSEVSTTIEQVRELQEPIPPDAPYAPDWRVLFIVDQGPTSPFRWYVRGLNDNCEPGGYGREFIWEVPRLDWRYDLSAAVLVTSKLEALRQKLEGA
jgi:hypothetical protein